MSNERKAHWEKIYTEKSPQQVSWTQSEPTTSIDFVNTTQLPMDAPIIDVGGGESHLVDHLLNLGYSDITVLDISKMPFYAANNAWEKTPIKLSGSLQTLPVFST